VTGSLRIAIVAAAGLLGPAAAFAQSLPAGTDACMKRIAATDDLTRDGKELTLADLCPEIVDALAATVWGTALLKQPPGDLDASSLAPLATLAHSYATTPGPGLEPRGLDEALSSLRAPAPEPQRSLWDRVIDWIQQRLGLGERDGSSALERWLEGLTVPERLVRYLVIALGVLLVVGAVAILASELKAAGVLAGGARRSRSRPSGAAAGALLARGRLDLASLDSLPLARRPAFLLALVLERLRRRPGAPALRDSLTHRELVGAAAALGDAERDALGAVAVAAERATFGDWIPEPKDAEALAARSAALIDTLDAAEAQAR
jgi:hypothetical protein